MARLSFNQALSILIAIIVLISNLVLFQRLNSYRTVIKNITNKFQYVDMKFSGLFVIKLSKIFITGCRSFIESQSSTENNQDTENTEEPIN